MVCKHYTVGTNDFPHTANDSLSPMSAQIELTLKLFLFQMGFEQEILSMRGMRVTHASAFPFTHRATPCLLVQ